VSRVTTHCVGADERDKPAGIFALPVEMIRDFAERCPTQAGTLEELHASLTEMQSVVSIAGRGGTLAARQLLPKTACPPKENWIAWLVKPTDGIYARLNRRIPFPSAGSSLNSPSLRIWVSIFTLGVGIAAAGFFAMAVTGALCSARFYASSQASWMGPMRGRSLKLQESDFGCWLETICGLPRSISFFLSADDIGQWRSSGTRTYLVYGGLLLLEP